jgi:16S rRNA (guanine527-N7)-methyltransferase
MLTHHLLDSLAVLPVLEKSALAGRRWADVGSGAGLPGIPLAIACPELKLTLVDAVDKKTAFQRQAKIELGLGNFEVAGGRVEDLPGAASMPRSRAPLPNWPISSGLPAICSQRHLLVLEKA